MLKLFRPALNVGIGSTGIALLRDAGRNAPVAAALGEAPIPISKQHSADVFTSAITQAAGDFSLKGRNLQIVLSDRWVRYFMVTPPKNAASLGDCRAAAAFRFKKLFGDEIDDWHIEGDWNLSSPFLAAATPSGLLAALTSAASASKAHLTGILPFAIAAWNRWSGKLGNSGWFGATADGVLHLFVIDAGVLLAIRNIDLPAEHDFNWLSQLITREALRLNTPMPDSVKVSGSVPSNWIGKSSTGFSCSILGALHDSSLSQAAVIGAYGASA